MRQPRRAERTLAGQRARLKAAEARTFAHYGIEASSELVVLEDPPIGVRVVRCGQGPATVLLHGASLTAVVWAPLVPHLPDRSIFLVDLPGCGLSDPFDYTGVDIAAHQGAFVGGVLDALGLQRAALVGASLGGMLALRFALERPERVTGLALVSAPALALPGARVPLPMRLGSGRLGRIMSRLEPPPSAAMTRRMLALVGGRASVRDGPDALFDALGAAMVLAGPTNLSAAAAMLRGSHPLPGIQLTDDDLRGCEVPVQLVWGSHDKVQGPDAAVRAAGVLPDAQVEILPGGHGIWLEHPARCGELLTDFLSSAERR